MNSAYKGLGSREQMGEVRQTPLELFRPADYTRLPMRWVNCACCNSASHVNAFRGDRYRFGLRTVVCSRCGLIFTNPRPLDAWFGEFYRLHYRRYYEGVTVPDADYLKRDWIAGRHTRNLATLSAYIADRGTILDIGCAEGTFLNLFRRRFPDWEVHGIEPSEGFSAFAREHYRLDGVVCRSIEDLSGMSASTFDLVTASHVLEHLLDPGAFFLLTRHLLRDDGRLFIDVPDAEAASHGIGNLHIAHLYHFSERSLRNFAARFGFGVLASQKGEERPVSWTLQMVLVKEKEQPTTWQPQRVDARRLAVSFARHCRTPVLAQLRRIARGVRHARWGR